MKPIARLALKQSPAELEVSRVAARDLDGPRKCNFCGKTEKVFLLTGPAFHVCEGCFEEDEGDA